MLKFDEAVATGLITWPNRVRMQKSAFKPDTSNTLADKFSEQVRDLLPPQSRTDLAYGLRAFLERAPDLVSWYEILVGEGSTTIRWRDAEPWVSPDQIQNWLRLLNKIDEDSLLTFHYARRFPDRRIEETTRAIANWRTICRSADHDLRTLWSRGVSDLHVHVGGTRIPHFIWMTLLKDPASFRRFPNVAKTYEKHFDSFHNDGHKRNTNYLEREADAARKLRLRICDLLQQNGFLGPYNLTIKRGANWSHHFLLPERLMLIEAWRCYESMKLPALLTALDAYLSARHLFFGLTRQPAFVGEVGLRTFVREHFPRLKQSRGRRDPTGQAWSIEPSPKLSLQPALDAVAFQSESRDLKKLELRIAPFNRAKDYWRFFKTWRRLQKVLDSDLSAKGHDMPDVRFAIHFLRDRSERISRYASRESGQRHLLKIWSEADRQSAALKVALSCPRRSRFVRDLARIDVAGEERDTPAAMYGLYFRLLRGDPEAVAFLSDYNPSSNQSATLKCWKRLVDQRRHLSDASQRRLGLTVHAGEDYADILDGVYQIDSAIEACGLEGGDSIGHGLALTDTHFSARPDLVFIEAGSSWDSLCWLYFSLFLDKVSAADNIDLAPDRRRIQEEILSIGHKIYKFIPGIRGLTAEEFVAVWKFHFRPRVQENLIAGFNSVQRAMIDCYTSKELLAAREEPMSLQARIGLARSIEIAQKYVMNKVIAKRICVELNPTSNLRITGVDKLHDLPTVGLLTATAKGLLACINTDDPGVFCSCIENEYSVLLHAGKTQVSEGEIYDLLEKVRAIGLERIY